MSNIRRALLLTIASAWAAGIACAQPAPPPVTRLSGAASTEFGVASYTRVITAGSTVPVSINDRVLIIDKVTGSATTVNLPLYLGHAITIVDGKGDATYNNITIVPPSGGSCNGASSCVINLNSDARTLESADGLNFFVSAIGAAPSGGGGSGSGTVGSGTAGQIGQYPSSGTTIQGVTVSGDGTIAAGGALVIGKIGGQAVSLGGPLSIPGAFSGQPAVQPTQTSGTTATTTINQASGATQVLFQGWGYGGYGGNGVACGASASCSGGAAGGGGDYRLIGPVAWPIGGATSCTWAPGSAPAHGTRAGISTLTCGTVVYYFFPAGFGADGSSTLAGGGAGASAGVTGGNGSTTAGGTGGIGNNGGTGTGTVTAMQGSAGAGGGGSTVAGAANGGGYSENGASGGGGGGGCNSGAAVSGSYGGLNPSTSNTPPAHGIPGSAGVALPGLSGSGGGGGDGSTAAAGNGGAGATPGGGGGGGGSGCAGTGTAGTGGAPGSTEIIATQW